LTSNGANGNVVHHFDELAVRILSTLGLCRRLSRCS
jgi:hypothetical protein